MDTGEPTMLCLEGRQVLVPGPARAEGARGHVVGDTRCGLARRPRFRAREGTGRSSRLPWGEEVQGSRAAWTEP